MECTQKLNNDWDHVTVFEEKIASYAGSKYAVACDSNSNAIRLVLHYLGVVDERIDIPARTYVSVPNQILLSGNTPRFVDKEWEGHYYLGHTPIIDSACAFFHGMYTDPNSYMILSFHHRKILNIGTGGMILTNDEKFNEWSRPMIYDGRNKYTMYNDDEFKCVGWHMYMTPEQAQTGLDIFMSDKIQDYNQPCGSSETYKDLREQKIYRKYQ